MNIPISGFAIFVLVSIVVILLSIAKLKYFFKKIHKESGQPGRASGVLDGLRSLSSPSEHASLAYGEVEHELGQIEGSWSVKIYRDGHGKRHISVTRGVEHWAAHFDKIKDLINAIDKILDRIPIQENLDSKAPDVAFGKHMGLTADNYLGSLNLIDNDGSPHVFIAVENIMSKVMASRTDIPFEEGIELYSDVYEKGTSMHSRYMRWFRKGSGSQGIHVSNQVLQNLKTKLQGYR